MVASYTQLLARRYQGRLDADADAFIGYAVDGANRMQELINDLLAYARLGRQDEPFVPTDCAEIFDATRDALKAVIEECGARVTCDALPRVLADRGQIQHLFQNLIGNAIKYRGKRPPEVHVSAERRNGAWIFAVRDNGIGIEPEYFERIFEVFQRLHTRSEQPGTGIGLAIAQKVVEHHGGRIWVDSRPGAGSTFYFTIPARGEAAHDHD